MKLSEARCIFTLNLARLVLHINSQPGYTCNLGEVVRTKAEAEKNAQQGDGIKNSLHCLGLAADLNLFQNKVYQTSTEAHERFGKYWRSLHPSNRWGGDFDGDGITDDHDGNHYEMRET